jgi:hypothetical protein
MFDSVKSVTHGSCRSDHQYITVLLRDRDLSTLPAASISNPIGLSVLNELICAILSIHYSMPSFGVCSSTSPARKNMLQYTSQLGLASHRIVMQLIHYYCLVEQCHLSQASALLISSFRNMGPPHRYRIHVKIPSSSARKPLAMA